VIPARAARSQANRVRANRSLRKAGETMSRYRMQDSTVVDTENAIQSWEEERDWNGSNHIGRGSGSQWKDQTLHKSRKGRYWIETKSRIQGTSDHAEWLSPEEATRWLLLMEKELPQDLAQLKDQVSE
jgi:hypothetical protein